MKRFLALLLFSASLLADPLPPIDPNAGPLADWANRSVQAGVFYRNGFDSHAEVVTGNELRPPIGKSGELLSAQPTLFPVPNNVFNGAEYPAFDTAQAASGNGALRLTANVLTTADHGGDWRFGQSTNNCVGGCARWANKPGYGDTLTFSYWVRENAAMNNYDWNQTGGERLKYQIIWRGGSSCGDMQVVIQAEKSPPKILNAYTNCAGNLTRYGIVGSQCNACESNFNYPPFGPAINTGAFNSSYWSQHSPETDNPYKYASPYTDESAYAYNPATGLGADKWIWFYGEVYPRNRNNGCGAWDAAGCSHIKIYMGKDGEVKQWIDFQWPWQVNISSPNFQDMMLTVYQTSKEFAVNPPNQYRWYDELILSTQPQHLPANLTIDEPPVDTDPPDAPSGLRMEEG